MKKIKVYLLTTEEKRPTREGNKYYYPHEKNKLWKIKCSKSDCTYEVFMNYQQIINNFSLRACDLKEKPDNLWNDEREDETWYIEWVISKPVPNWDLESWSDYDVELMTRIPCPTCLMNHGKKYDWEKHGHIENPVWT